MKYAIYIVESIDKGIFLLSDIHRFDPHHYTEVYFHALLHSWCSFFLESRLLVAMSFLYLFCSFLLHLFPLAQLLVDSVHGVHSCHHSANGLLQTGPRHKQRFFLLLLFSFQMWLIVLVTFHVTSASAW